MTREEAKELLLHILMTYEPKDQYGDYDDPEPYEQALTMATESLSADADGEDLIIKGAKGIQDGLYNIKDGKLFKYKAKGGTVRTYPIVPSVDAVPNCKTCAIKELWEETEKEDLVAVVRCKDCIHWKADNEVFELGFCCVYPQKWVAETFYCADGERREP